MDKVSSLNNYNSKKKKNTLCFCIEMGLGDLEDSNFGYNIIFKTTESPQPTQMIHEMYRPPESGEKGHLKEATWRILHIKFH